MQNNMGNTHSPYTIIVTIKHDESKRLPIQVVIPKGVAGLTKNSVVDCAHLDTIKKEELREFCGILPPHHMKQVDQALAISLGLRLA